jgi:hypothetical protein
MNLIKTPLSSRLTQRNLEALMRISMEGRDKLSDSHLDTLVHKFKNKKDRYMMLLLSEINSTAKLFCFFIGYFHFRFIF